MKFGTRGATILWVLSAMLAKGERLTPKAILNSCATRMGGVARIEGAAAAAYTTLGHSFSRSIEVSPDVPGPTVYEETDVRMNLQSESVRETLHWQWSEAPGVRLSTTVVTPDGAFVESDGTKHEISAGQIYRAIDILGVNPISAITAALRAPHLTLSESGTVYKIVFDREIYRVPVRTTLGVDKQSRILRWIELRHDYSKDPFTGMWGNVTRRFVFGSWYLDPSGVYFPRKWRVLTNGREDGQVSLLTFMLNPPASSGDFEIPREYDDSTNKTLSVSLADIAKRNHGDGDHVPLADGIMMVPGRERAYNSLIVKQEKGFVIVEAPYSSANSEYLMEYARKLFPGASPDGLVTTSQMWFHIAGVPAFARAKVPVYVLSPNGSLVGSLIRSQDSSAPAPAIVIVRKRTEVGSGPNKIVLFPFWGTASARMMAVYFPYRHLLYCSDVFLPVAWGHDYWIEHLSEIRDLISREHLRVETVVGLSMPATDWKSLAVRIPSDRQEHGE